MTDRLEADSGPGEPGDLVDLRSDTVTRPTPEMRQVMAAAVVGDDALGDDPTVQLLEERVAELLGKDRALFFPSGVMANQTALAVQGRWGGEVVVEADAHVVHWEDGAAAALSGLQLRPVRTPDGILRAEHVRNALRPPSRYLPRTCLVSVENTHLASGGRIVPVEVVEEVAEVAHEHGLPVHLDGARLWHAAAETGREPRAWTAPVDTVMVALSKGLGAPVGSVLAGRGPVMEEAWRVRRRLGGAMRQSGILAAAGLHALENHRERLREDHENARVLAAAFDAVPGLRAVPPETNVVLVEVTRDVLDPEELLNFLAIHRILMLEFGDSRLRAVTHRDVDSRGIKRVLTTLRTWAERLKGR
jgi:threonine aldolase